MSGVIPARAQNSGRSTSPPAWRRAGGRRAARGGPCASRVSANHAERQELVALEPQDRLEPLDVVVGEETVAAACSPWPEQALILEVPDLRDGDVGELLPQALADGANRVEARIRRRRGNGGGRHGTRKVNRYFPICTSSSAESSAVSIRRRLTNVPLRLPRSRMTYRSFSWTISAWRRDTVTSSRNTWHSGERPISVRRPLVSNVSPALPPPARTTSAGMRGAWAAATSSTSSSGSRLRVVSPCSSRRR